MKHAEAALIVAGSLLIALGVFRVALFYLGM